MEVLFYSKHTAILLEASGFTSIGPQGTFRQYTYKFTYFVLTNYHSILCCYLGHSKVAEGAVF